MTGEMLKADAALSIGLVNKVFPADQLIEEAMKTAQLISSKGRASVRAVKEVIDRGTQIDLHAGCALEIAAFATIFSSMDAKEGLSAFVEKRDPDFKGDYNS